MIEFMQGILITKAFNHLVLQVGGIGYRLHASSHTLAEMPVLQEEVNLYTYLVIREDELSLYGFAWAEEREIFTALLQISGIGPKLALAILSHLRVADFRKAVIFGDAAALVQVPGVGKKTAQRIILELKDKLSDSKAIEEPGGAQVPGGDIRNQAIAALQSLGYSLAEAQKALPAGNCDDMSCGTVEELLRQALRKLAHL